jgi:putative endonuclease
MFYYTYVLLCSNKSQIKKNLYIGYTKDINKRYQRHINKEVYTTKKFDELKLIYFESCLNKTDARKRELQLKTGFGRGYINKRISTYLKTIK